jgi:hypothetical protein
MLRIQGRFADLIKINRENVFSIFSIRLFVSFINVIEIRLQNLPGIFGATFADGYASSFKGA